MKNGKLLVRILGGALTVAALAWFAYANDGRYVDLRFGLFTLRDLSLPVVIFGSVIVGMLLVIAVSWRTDLRMRQALKKYDQIGAGVMNDVGSERARDLEEVNPKN